jgi:RNA polymerase sigma-70 factor (ECF subfamily)
MGAPMEKWQAGDMAAFEVLFNQYKGLVFKNAYLMTGSRDDAEDVLQEVFAAVWRSRQTFDPQKGRLATWLHRITVNECLRRSRRRRPAVVDLEQVELADRRLGPEETLMTAQDYETLVSAMNGLDARHRAVLVLRYFNDLSYEEIAQAVGIPLGTVKSRMNQALKRLRGRLGGGAP